MSRASSYFHFTLEWGKRKSAGLCPACGNEREQFAPNRKVYCSVKCADAYAQYYTDWHTLREKVLQRDNHTCQKCGRNPDSTQKEYLESLQKKWDVLKEQFAQKIEGEKFRLLQNEEEQYLQRIKKIEQVSFEDYQWIQFFQTQGVQLGSKYTYSRIQLEVDHKKAIMNEGEMWDAENLQTLCQDCHHLKTSHDHKIRKGKGNKKITEVIQREGF